MVAITDDEILVKTAYNSYDTTRNRLYLSQILMALWRREGKETSDLTYLGWENVNNDGVTDALEGARDFLDLGSTEGFTLTSSGTDEDIWDLFRYTSFGKVATRICGITGKRVRKIIVSNNRGADTVTWVMAL
ncbi:hypothetical protein CORC01_07162 [Colletotrichum orchidophilum]|uniref:Uncharacterized protein n=1 Tax=Colletotrichum orchidophilum TaxID=1209926 RepID=A0A1G4B806_9PEZI|nr:uncharacterized protein CORC01_07162 [Colletotrichum orchidophilum]OHE97547.1 hypothetical protein CORC01_07162 [Colletotrichum orchidophilum]